MGATNTTQHSVLKWAVDLANQPAAGSRIQLHGE